jgi:ribonuclease P protein component
MAPNGGADPSSSSAGDSRQHPKSARLLRHEDFQRVYQQGRRHFSPHMTVFYLPRAEGGCRVGLTVGRVLGGAVDRNRIKRRMREAVRLERQALATPADMVINPKKSVLKAEFNGLREEVRRAFEAIQQKLKEKAPTKRDA